MKKEGNEKKYSLTKKARTFLKRLGLLKAEEEFRTLFKKLTKELSDEAH